MSKEAGVLAWSTKVKSAYWAIPWIDSGMLLDAVPSRSTAALLGSDGSGAATIAVLATQVATMLLRTIKTSVASATA